ncbi:hypothetical protein DV736_g4293, partial [Chaetothyriales sp. CBS 134916]
MAEFKAKNLTYDKSQPAFLQRLRAEFGGERNNVQFERPNKPRLQIGDAEEDGPTIVDDSGEGVSKEEYERMLKGEEEDVKGAGPNPKDSAVQEDIEDMRDEEDRVGVGDARVSRQKVAAEIGNAKKRKVGKVVGSDAGEKVEEGDAVQTKQEQHHNDIKKPTSATHEAGKAPKKKAKKIKLSFDDAGEG